jgi:DNA-binding transcriptional regulator YbjK
MNDDDWNTAKGSIDSYFDDIDDGLHKALAHFR